jgi:GT2 family glycosyltransferase
VYRELLEADEVIVVDNRSTDGSPQFIREHFPSVRLSENQDNRGFAAACNQGASLARGHVLIFLNQDTEVEPGWLRGLLTGLGEDGAGLTTSKLLLMSQRERIHLSGQEVHFTGLTLGRGFLEPADRFNTPGAVSAVAGASFAIRRELWERLGGFDESLFMYYEETDLSWRARSAGYRCLYTPESVAYHDYRPSEPGYLKLYYSKRNRYVLMLKHWRWRTLLLLFPGILLAEMLDWGQALLIGGVAVRAKIHASGWVASHLGTILAGRRIVQQQRRCSDLPLLESCVSSIKLLAVSAGALGRGIVMLCNLCFRLNYLTACSILRLESRAVSHRDG